MQPEVRKAGLVCDAKVNSFWQDKPLFK